MNRRVLLVSSTMMSGSNGPSKMIRMLNSEKAYLPFKLDVLTEDGDNTDAFSLKLRATRLLPQLGMIMRCVDYSWAAIKLHRRNKFDVVVFNFAPFGLIFKMLTLRVPVAGFINDDTGVGTSDLLQLTNGSGVLHWAFLTVWQQEFSTCLSSTANSLSKHMTKGLIAKMALCFTRRTA